MFAHMIGIPDAGRSRKKEAAANRLIAVLPVIFGLLTVISLFLPAFIGRIGGYLYYVRGIDMLFGRAVSSDPDGIIPQVEQFIMAAAVLFGFLSLLLKNKKKAIFLNCALSVIALIMQTLLPFRLMRDTSSLIAESISYGYFITEILLLLLLVSGIMNTICNKELVRDIKKHLWLYILGAIVVAYCLVFFYYPMYGVIIAFKDYSPKLGILGSNWVGFEHFKSFFSSYYF